MVQTIDVANAQAFDPQDKRKILEGVVHHHGSASAFDTSLKLQLLMDPTSYNVDLEQLLSRSKETKWRLERVKQWLDDPTAPRALCIMAGAGQGKSTISAAIAHQLLGLLKTEGSLMTSKESPSRIAAMHFIKFSDQRRLDPLCILRSLAFQLAKAIPSFAEKLLLLDADDIAKLKTPEDAFKMLLSSLSESATPLVLLIDALDEGDPLDQQKANADKSFKPFANKVLTLVINILVPLLPKARFILTTRPDAVFDNIRTILRRSFDSDGIKGVHFIENPSELRVEEEMDDQSHRVLVFDTVVQGCKDTLSDLPRPQCPSLKDLYGVYRLLFDYCKPSPEVKTLLNVIMAAQEPLSLSFLESSGLAQHLASLPGWGVLAYASEHRVVSLSSICLSVFID